ncbi:hypothetical protein QYE76_043951 [Lolium multiflorum]|uniref:Uncharacterized protein n=1 Tax=Lolium multiflorum TaxID=4521 RepID=A0AAD8WYN2_LOLMU|nr:hypothetical protein QYE76_043951 [Lolium multiflorum]
MLCGGPTAASFSSRTPSSRKPKPQRVPHEDSAASGRRTPERKELSGRNPPGKFPPGGEIDAIAIVIDLDIISIIIIIISTIYTAITTAAPRHRCNDLVNPSSKLLVNTFCSSLGSTFLLIEDTTIYPLYLWVITCQEVDSLKEELSKLKERLKEEETRAAEKDELLRQSSLALLETANIPAAALDAAPNNSPANGVSMALASHQLTRELLERGKGALARMHLMIFPKLKQDKTLGQLVEAFAVDTKEVIEVFPVPSFVDDSSGALPEVDRIQRMKDRITQMEKDLRSTYALAAIVNKKSEIAADVERYALTELHKATESLNCKFLGPDSLC